MIVAHVVLVGYLRSNNPVTRCRGRGHLMVAWTCRKITGPHALQLIEYHDLASGRSEMVNMFGGGTQSLVHIVFL